MSLRATQVPVELVWALLIAGHLLADFVFQSRAMVEGKRRERRWLLAHGLEVLLVQGLVLLPFCPGWRAGLTVAGIALAHVGIDALKVWTEERFGRRLLWFALDQLTHAGVLVAACAWIAAGGVEVSGFARPDLSRLAWIVGLYAFNVNGGSAVVSAVLDGLRTSAKPPSSARAGHVIGILERMAMLTLVWLGQWSALGFVLAAKSVARFKELENRDFAETYLVGTLTSFLVACASGLLLRSLTGWNQSSFAMQAAKRSRSWSRWTTTSWILAGSTAR